MIENKIPLCRPEFTIEMKEAAIHALENEHFVLGESVFKFEKEFAKYIGTKYAVSVNSGTSALELSMIAIGIKKSERVITTPNSFIATANSILMAGGMPVFSDVKQSDGNVDENLIKIDGEKGIIPVHIYGNPCNIESILSIAKENNIFVVEDACQAHGAEFRGRKVGSIGDVGCFSFYSTKNMTVCGDGGMITTNREDIANTAAKLRDCGRVSKYEHDMIGFTKRLNTVNAAIGRIQLRMLDKWNSRRSDIAEIYKKILPNSYLLEKQKFGNSVYHIFAIKHPNRDNLAKHLSERGISTGIHYPIPIHKQDAYIKLGYKIRLPVAEDFSRNVISLPIFPSMTNDQTKYVAESVNEVVK